MPFQGLTTRTQMTPATIATSTKQGVVECFGSIVIEAVTLQEVGSARKQRLGGQPSMITAEDYFCWRYRKSTSEPSPKEGSQPSGNTQKRPYRVTSKPAIEK